MCFQFYVALLFCLQAFDPRPSTPAFVESAYKKSPSVIAPSSCRTIITTLLMPLPQLQLIPMPWT